MTVRAITPDYHGDRKDSADHFHGQQLLYVLWEQHLMYATPHCIPVPPGMPFAALRDQVLPTLYAGHLQAARIDWTRAEWTRDDTPFTPDPAASLADNGLGHKSLLQLRTPDLAGLHGVAF